MTKTYWVSLRRIKIHEFTQTIRLLKNTGTGWPAILSRLSQMQRESTQKAFKSLGLPIVFYYTLQAFGGADTISVSFQDITISAPAGIISMAASLTIVFVVLHLQNSFMTIALRSKEVRQIYLRNLSISALTQYNGDEEMGLSIPAMPYGFWQERIPVSSILGFFLLIILSFFLVPIAALSVFLASYQFDLLVAPETGFLNNLGAFLGLVCLTYTLIYLLLFNIPMPMRKNNLHVRWGFLYKISETFPHPQREKWLE